MLALIIPLLIGCIWGLMVHWIPLVHLRILKKKFEIFKKKIQIFTCWLIMIRCTPWAHHLLWLWMWRLWCSRCAQVHWIHLIHKIIDRRVGMCYRCSRSTQWCCRSLKIAVRLVKLDDSLHLHRRIGASMDLSGSMVVVVRHQPFLGSTFELLQFAFGCHCKNKLIEKLE